MAEVGRVVYCGWRIDGSKSKQVSGMFRCQMKINDVAGLTEETDKKIEEAVQNCHWIEKRKEIEKFHMKEKYPTRKNESWRK